MKSKQYCSLIILFMFSGLAGFSQVIIDGNMAVGEKRSLLATDYLRRFEFLPYVITQDETISAICEVKVSGISSIVIKWNLGSLFMRNNNPIDSLVLLDDGQNGDVLANDNIFTISNLTRNATTFAIDDVKSFFLRFCDVRYLFSNGTSFTENLDLACGIRFINTQKVTIPEVNKISDTIQYSSNVFNYVSKWNSTLPYDYWNLPSAEIRATRSFYKYFPDDRDFLSVCTTFPTPNAPAGWYGSIKNEVIGLSECQGNTCKYDYSSDYGTRQLLGIMTEFYTYGGTVSLINHELLHQWAAFLNSKLYLAAGAHWGAVEFPTSGFGSGVQRNHFYHYQDNIYRGYNDESYSSKYNSLELYLMGLLPFDSVSFPIKTLVNYTFLGYTLDQSVTPSRYVMELSADSIHYVSKAEYLQNMLLRSPDYLHSQKDFKMALIVVSNRLLTPKEMAYYNYNMKKVEETTPDPNYLNYYNATGGRSTLRTKLSNVVITAIEKAQTIENEVILYPNPARKSISIGLRNIASNKLFVEIYSIDGMLLENRVFQGEGERRLTTERLAEGIYYMKITIYSPGGEVKTVTRKFVKD
jgi:hypothetical protein